MSDLATVDNQGINANDAAAVRVLYGANPHTSPHPENYTIPPSNGLTPLTFETL